MAENPQFGLLVKSALVVKGFAEVTGLEIASIPAFTFWPDARLSLLLVIAEEQDDDSSPC